MKLPLPLSASRLDQAIALSTGYLARHTDAGGRFAYRIFSRKGRIDDKKYNALRHAGAIYALAQTGGSRNPASRETILRAASYLSSSFIHPVDGLDGGLSAVFSFPDKETLASGHREAKLGGTALGIIALLAAAEIEPNAASPDVLRSLGRFLLFMQEDDGHFRSKYSEIMAFEVDFNSLYYPGQAILALTRLYAFDGDPVWLEAAARATGYLVRHRQGTPVKDLPKDHWLMIAIDELMPRLDGSRHLQVPSEDIYEHAVQLGYSMLREQQGVAGKGPIQGSFKKDGRSTPTATRIEGLVALHQMAERHGDSALMRDIVAAMVPATEFLMRCQIDEGPYAGGILRAIARLPKTEQNRKFNRRQAEIRIDYVQHAMSAFYGLRGILESANNERN